MRKRKNVFRLTALLLSLLLLLSGCGSPEDNLADISANTPDADASAGAPAEKGPEDSIAEGRLNRLGLMKGEAEPITEDQASTIMGAVASMERAYAVRADGTDPLIENRDWSIYSSDLGREPLSRAELELYDRFDKVAMKYLTQSNLNGEQNRGSYYLSGVQYSDLGLTWEQAFDLLIWFEYNNPQYYFLNSACSYTDDSIFTVIYDFMADGERRAEITNELFNKLESWVQTVESSAANTYQKEVCASNLICESVTYDHDALLPRNSEAMSLCQSLYSVVIRENTVCAGYSKAFCAIMSALGVDATAGISSTHAWNVVRFDDGNYYCVDVCWNDTDDDPPYENDYINVGDKDSKAGDNGRECHIYEDCYVGWIPALAAESYKPTNEDTGATVRKLSAPQNVKVTENADALNFTWDAVPDANGYIISRFDNSDYEGIPVWSNPASESEYAYLKAQSFEMHSIKPGTTYYFGVRAYSGEREGEKVYSDWTYLSMTTAGEEHPAPAVTQLDAPSNIYGQYNGGRNALVYWDAVDGATGYEVNIYTNAEHFGEPEKAQISASGILRLTALSEGSTVYMTIRAIRKENGRTIYSDWVDFDYTHGKSSTLDSTDGKPINLWTGYLDKESAYTNWETGWNSDYSGVEYCQYTDSTCTETKEGPIKSYAEGHTWTGLEVGKTYYFGFRAFKQFSGDYSYYDWVNVTYTHKFVAPDAPENIHADQIYTDNATITWEKARCATEYEVNVYKDRDHSDLLQTARVSSSSSFRMENLNVGERYYLRIRSIARDDSQELYSDWVDTIYMHAGRS